MTQQDTLCTIYYSDGREEGPISAMVIKDLIQAGVLGPNDRVSELDQAPMTVSTHPLFSAIWKQSRPAGAVTAVKLSRRRGTSSSSALPTPSSRIEQAAAQLAGRPSSPSGSAIPARPQTPASSGSEPGIRASGSQPAVGASAAARSESAGPPPSPQSRTKRVDFSQIALNKGPEHLRDKLLMATLADILGVDLSDSGEALDRAYVARATQINEAFSGNRGKEDRLALADILNILLKSHEVLTQATQRVAYDVACEQAGKELSFQNYVSFTFANDESLASMPAPSPARAPTAPVPAAPVPAAPAPAARAPAQAVAQAPAAAPPGPRRRALQPDAAGELPPENQGRSGLRRLSEPAPPSVDEDTGDEGATSVMSITDLAQAIKSPPSASSLAPESLGSFDVLSSGDEVSDLFNVGTNTSISGEMSIDAVIQAMESEGGVDDSISKIARALGFSQASIDKGPVNLRDHLLMSTLPDILSVNIDATFEEVSKIYVARSSHINKAFPSSKTRKEERLAVSDILSILLATHDILGDAARRAEYKAASEARGRQLSFQNHVPFTFASEASAFSKSPLPPLKASTAPRKTATTPAVGAAPASSRTSQERKAVAPAAAKEKPKEKPPEKPKKKKSQFGGAEWRDEGEPFKGHLAFGVGEAGRGLKHALGVYIAGVLLTVLLLSSGFIGEAELGLIPGDVSIYFRNGLLFAVGFLALLAVRRESPVRFGLMPKIGATILALPVAFGIGIVASAIARFNITDPATTLEAILPLLVVRSLGESIFFHGFVTRTLLIEFKQPALALMLSSLLYGLYALTYPALTGGAGFNTLYAVMVYGFGGGLPIAMIYWQTRSILVVAVCHFIILLMAANGGITYATRLAS